VKQTLPFCLNLCCRCRPVPADSVVPSQALPCSPLPDFQVATPVPPMSAR
jgi:hypothetical protein